MKIIADQGIPYLKGVLEPFAEVRYLPSTEIAAETVQDADALMVRTRTRCNQALLEKSRVAFIGSATTGNDHIDREYLQRAGIAYADAPASNAMSVVQYVMAALFELSYKYGFNLQGKTLGIIGVGSIGSRVAKMAAFLGMNVLLNDPPRAKKEGKKRFDSLASIRVKSDFITLHVPLHQQAPHSTLHMVDQLFLGRMRPNAFLINAARGPVVDNIALMKALKNQQLQGAIIDCWENEPDISMSLLDYVDIGTPHIAGYSRDGKAQSTAMVVQALAKHFGLPLTQWYPQNIEPPAAPEINLNNCGKTPEALLREAVLHTYSIASDDYKLRSAPGRFEYLRNHYPVRREFNAFIVNGDIPPHIRKKLKAFGFRTAS